MKYSTVIYLVLTLAPMITVVNTPSEALSTLESEIISEVSSEKSEQASSQASSNISTNTAEVKADESVDDQRVNGTGIILYYKQGVLVSKETYSKNILNTLENYNSNGQVIKYTQYYSNGNIKIVKSYKNNVITDYKGFYSNGSAKFDYNYYSNGVPSSYFTKDEKGKFIKSQKWYSNRTTSYLLNFKNGVKYSEYYYYSNGKVKSKSSFYSKGTIASNEVYATNGIKTAISKWNSNGKQTEKLKYYTNGKLKSDYDYYTNGKLRRYRSYYSSGRKGAYYLLTSSGKYTYRMQYYSNGKVKERYEFNKDKSLKSIKRYSTTGKYTYYRLYFSNGKVKSSYDKYFSNGKPKSRIMYTYYPNRVIKTKVQTDYDINGNYSTIKWSYNSKGVEQSEKMTNSTKLTYFKVPIKGYLTCQYNCYDDHTGIDLGSTNKSISIKPTAPGVVVQTGSGCPPYGGKTGNTCNGGAGNYVVVRHNYKGQNYFSVYMHLSKIKVKVNQKVSYSTTLGNMGNSGNSSATHLHFELYKDTDNDGIRSDEVRTNPAIYVDFSNIFIKY